MLIKDRLISIGSGEMYYTHLLTDAYRVTRGAVSVYMVMYSQEGRAARSQCIARADERAAIAIPGFCVTVEDGERWVFAIAAEGECAELTREPCEYKHQKAFLDAFGVEWNGIERFEACFFKRYHPQKRIRVIRPLAHIPDREEPAPGKTALDPSRTMLEGEGKKAALASRTVMEEEPPKAMPASRTVMEAEPPKAVPASRTVMEAEPPKAVPASRTVMEEEPPKAMPASRTVMEAEPPKAVPASRAVLQEEPEEKTTEKKQPEKKPEIKAEPPRKKAGIVIGDGVEFSAVDGEHAYVVQEGAVYVYLQPVQKSGDRGLKQNLCEVDTNTHISIPGLCYQYNDMEWRISIAAKSGDAKLREIPSSPDAQRRFIKAVQNSTENNQDMNLLDGFANEGYAQSLIQYYIAKKNLRDVVRQEVQEDNKKGLRKRLTDIIRIGVKGGHIEESGSSEAYRALSYLCRKGGIDLLPESEIEHRCSKVTLPEMARVSHFICREVVLDADWYKSDCGLLMCMLDDHVVACAPMAGGGYRMYDPHTGRETKLTAKVARTIHPKAHSIRRCLPARGLKFKDLFQFVCKGIYGRDIFYTVLLGALCLLVSILLPYLNQKIYDDYIPMGDTNMLLQMCLVTGTFMLGNIFFTLVKKLYEFRIATRAGYELQDAIFARIFELPESFLRKYESGDLAQRVQGFGSVANQIVTKAVVTGISTVFALLYLFQMVHYAKKLVLGAVLMVAAYGLVVYFVSILSVKHEAVVAEKNNESVGRLQQYLAGVQKIRMAGAEQHAIVQYTKPVAEQQQAAIRAARIAEIGDVLRDAGSTIFSMVLYFLMVHNKMELSTGNFIAFNTAFGSLAGAILELVNELIELRCMKPELDMLKPVIESVPETDADKNLDAVTELKGGVALEHVTFSYVEDGAPVLRDISFRVKPGEYVGLVGRSGCGKSTIFKLLLGFETPKSGRVLYDDKDLRALDKHSLRKRLGVVLQNGSLISGSIYDNIVITSENPSRKAAEEAVEKVGLKEDIAAMPMHLDTVINESAGTISGGQKQRILIARAIAGKPNVLLFDEATSALDNITQAKVCESLDQMNVTRIVIAHRLSTIEHCDRIIVLDKGVIKEEGTYKELYARRGLFYEMARRQIAGVEEEEQ